MADVLLKRTLDEIGLQSLVTRFEEERIDGNDVLTLSDGEKKNWRVCFFNKKLVNNNKWNYERFFDNSYLFNGIS